MPCWVLGKLGLHPLSQLPMPPCPVPLLSPILGFIPAHGDHQWDVLDPDSLKKSIFLQ